MTKEELWDTILLYCSEESKFVIIWFLSYTWPNGSLQPKNDKLRYVKFTIQIFKTKSFLVSFIKEFLQQIEQKKQVKLYVI